MIYRITLTESELQALSGLLDAGVRSVGLRAVNDASRLLSRIDGAEKLPDTVVTTEESNGNPYH